MLLLLLSHASVMSNSVQPHKWQPTRLPHPSDSPGKNTGVGCHFLLQCVKVKSEREVTQSCSTLCVPMDCSPTRLLVHGILQARVLEWGAIAFSAAISIFLNKIPFWDFKKNMNFMGTIFNLISLLWTPNIYIQIHIISLFYRYFRFNI